MSSPGRASAVHTVCIDVLIVGGGIAGLWLLTTLRQNGFRALLIEAQALGTGQTIWSQGIIHGGLKYALTGKMSKAACAIAEMPDIWRECLHGRGEVDLRTVNVFSQCQHLWTVGGPTARLGAFAASKVLRAKPQAVAQADRPEALRSAPVSSRIYRLDEPVLEMRSLLGRLAELNAGALLHAPAHAVTFERDEEGRVVSAAITLSPSMPLRLSTRAVVLTAGAGNEALCSQLGISSAPMQRRPLHQVLVKGTLPPLFGHCIAGLADTPRLTVTSDATADGETVWNIGGDLAESGIERTSEAQCRAAAHELARALPWIDPKSAMFSSEIVDRAEPRTPGVKRPDLPFLRREDNVFICWPTKLAFAPRLSREVIAALREANIDPKRETLDIDLSDFAAPPVATPPWEEPEREWFTSLIF